MQTEVFLKYGSCFGIIKFIMIMCVSTFIFSYLPKNIIKERMSKILPPNENFPSSLSVEIGILERTIYIFSIVSGLEQIILGWLAIKALQDPFKHRSISLEQNNMSHIQERKNFEINKIVVLQWVTIGNGISLLVGVIGGIITKQVLVAFI